MAKSTNLFKSSLRTPKLRSRTHNTTRRKIEAILKRSALKLNGKKDSKAAFTTVKLTPQTKLITISITSVDESPNFASPHEPPCFPKVKRLATL